MEECMMFVKEQVELLLKMSTLFKLSIFKYYLQLCTKLNKTVMGVWPGIRSQKYTWGYIP